MEEVLFGVPAAEAVAEQAQRLDAHRVFLMVSGTLNRDTDEIERVRQALGNRCAAVFDRMPPHTPRSAVIAAAAQARDASADLIVTIGGGSITDGAKAVRLCLANDILTTEALDALRPVPGPDGALGPPPCNAPAVLRWNKPANAGRQALVAASIGHPGAEAADLLDRFIADLGMPRSLAAVNIGADSFGRIAEQAMGTPWVPRNPRPIAGPAQVREILELAA
ncbi:MAG: iron-containing alcohol dehydrogenase [Alphaproteobacteria bacterium]|nr:iron-containing alcohol dehydrogenase [Alphaproteobacteria bacterium]